MGREEVEGKGDIEGEDSKKINDIQKGNKKLKLELIKNYKSLNFLELIYLVRRNSKSYEIFQSKPTNKNGFSDTEKVSFFTFSW